MSTELVPLGTTPLRRWCSFVATAAVLGGLLSLGGVAPAAEAAEDTGSAVTVKWAGGNDPAIQQYQPDHAALTSDGQGNDAGSGHWDDFKNLRVTVSKTKGVLDEAVSLHVSGMPPNTVTGHWASGRDFLQAFQCYGDPTSPDFNQTCQFGAFSVAAGSKSGGVLRGDTIGRGWLPEIPFKAVTGEVSKRELAPGEPEGGTTVDGTSAFFTDATSNERSYIPVLRDGSAEVAFELQSAAAAPHLGCGDTSDKGAGERCWLVVVPRGLHSGQKPGAQPQACSPYEYGTAYGDVTQTQEGSPLAESTCTFWDDRILIPLDFDDPFQRCAAGAERRVSGSELLGDAFASWQPALCTGDSAAAFGFTTNSGTLTRSQLLTGVVPFGLVSTALTPETIGETDPDLLKQSDLRYAPLANSALTIAFVAESDGGATRFRDMRLTPRLLAKLLTQSYYNQVPQVSGSFSPAPHAGLQYLVSDPEWNLLNPDIQLVGTESFVVSGPAGDDGIRLLWRYVQSDADAAAFLRGEPDPWGLSVNPYYLPAGHPSALGGGLPFDLANDPLDVFMRADQSVSPADPAEALTWYRGQQVDSITLLPYSANLTANAPRVFRTDSRFPRWDRDSVSGFVPFAPRQLGERRLVIGPTTAAASARYDLDTAALATPLSHMTTEENLVSSRRFVSPTAETIARGIARQGVGDSHGISSAAPSSATDGAYPVTASVYGVVDLAGDRLDLSSARDYAHLIEYATSEGQVPGTARGQLPPGYVPLTGEQVSVATSVAAELRAWQPRRDPDALPLPAEKNERSSPPGVLGSSGVGIAPASAIQSQTQTATSRTSGVGGTGESGVPAGFVGGALIAGFAGLATSPILLRRRSGGL